MNDQIVIDGTDHEVLDLLLRDGRMTLAEIGASVSLSPPAVKRRLTRLEETGVIKGFTAVLDHEILGRPIEAFTELRFGGRTKVEDISGTARDLPEVDAVYTIAGDPDALVHLRVRDVADLTRVIDQLRRTGKVVGTKTLIVLASDTAQARAARRG